MEELKSRVMISTPTKTSKAVTPVKIKLKPVVSNMMEELRMKANQLKKLR